MTHKHINGKEVRFAKCDTCQGYDWQDSHTCLPVWDCSDDALEGKDCAYYARTSREAAVAYAASELDGDGVVVVSKRGTRYTKTYDVTFDEEGEPYLTDCT